MPKAWRFFQLEQEEDQRRHNEALVELATLDEELALYDHPAWNRFVGRLEAFEQADLEILVGAPIEEVERARERIKLVRRIKQVPDDLRRRRQELLEFLGLEEVDDAQG